MRLRILIVALIVAPMAIAPLAIAPMAIAEPPPVDPNDPAARIAAPALPKPAAPQFAPITTGFSLNNTRIDHRTQWDLALGLVAGNDRNETPSLRGTWRLDQTLAERIEGRRYRRAQTGWYFQAATFNRVRDVTLTRSDPVTVIGAHIQLSITGTCALPGRPPDAYCTYTPGLSVDAASRDPEMFVPTRFTNDTAFGAIVTPETLDAIRQPGWQRGAPGGQSIGLDLDFPNAGYVVDEDRRGASRVTRRETVELGQVLALSQVRQDLMTNDRGAALTRTVRGLVLPGEEHLWSKRAVALQVLAWLVPALEPGLQSGPGAPSLKLNNNLFLAANNARLPRDSFTFLHTGIAWVGHPQGEVKRLQDVPAAHYLGLWVGLSPIIDRVQTNSVRLLPLGRRETLAATFAQGGGSGAVAPIAVQTVLEGHDGSYSNLDIAALQDPFIQFGLGVSEQPADLVRSSQLLETTRYVPSLSITGTRTSAEHVLRYYAGLMEGENTDRPDLNAYGGLDWTYNSATGWRINLAGIGYSKPNYDYFSELSGRVHRIFQAPFDTKLALGVSAAYALDRPGNFESFVLDYDASRLDVSAEAQRGKWSLMLTQGINQVLPDSRAPSTTLRLGYQPLPTLELSASLTPYSEQTSYLAGQLGLTWRLSAHKAQPTLRVQWSRIQYDYGVDGFGDPLDATEDVFSLSLQMRFDGTSG